MERKEEKRMVKALVVDDQPAVLRLVSKLLNRFGVETIETSDAESALLAYLEENPDIVFSDFVMPGMDVTTFYRALKAIKEDLPIVMFTGYLEQMMAKMKELEIEPDYVLEKPFQEDDILPILRERFPDAKFNAGP